MKVTKTTERWLTTFDVVKGMMMQFLKLAEADATVAEAMAAIDLLNENSFDQTTTCVASANVVRSNNLMAPPANKKKRIIVDTADMLSSASKVLANFSFQLPTGLVLRPFGLDRIAPAGALPSVIAQRHDGSVDGPMMNEWKKWASSLMDALLDVGC
jgi:hypothetical protein